MNEISGGGRVERDENLNNRLVLFIFYSFFYLVSMRLFSTDGVIIQGLVRQLQIYSVRTIINYYV